MKSIKELAKLAGVSQSTVSKALNGRPDVSKKTREKVMKIAQEHNFSPNAFGKALKMRTTQNIGVIFRKDVGILSGNPFYSRVLEGIEAETALNGYNLVLHMVPEHQQYQIPKMVREGQVDGVLLVGILKKKYIQLLLDTGLPVTVIDPKMLISGCPQVLIDNENGAFLAVEHLIRKGHRRIGFISGDISRLSFSQRLEGYKKAHNHYGIPVDENLIQIGKIEGGYELTRSLLTSAKPPDGIFAVNDINAVLGYKAAAELGLHIPQDISFVGFDDTDLSMMAIPPLTTVRVYKEELGSVAVRSLYDLISGNVSEPVSTVVPVRLIERESVRDRRP